MAAGGFLLIDKPEGPTSFRILKPLRRLAPKGRIGYAGTLDSGASGLLVAATGASCRLLSLVEAGEKEYLFRLHLGFSTDTGDLTGTETERAGDAARTAAEVRAVLPDFLGEQLQVPPVYSALKIKGKRASDLARRGKEVELAARRIEVKELELLEPADGPENHMHEKRTEFALRCVVSKGTYVRALGRDLAKALGTVGCVSKIRRTRIGSLRVGDAWSWNEDETPEFLPPEEAIPLPRLTADPLELKLLRNGVRLDLVRFRAAGPGDGREPKAGDRFFVLDESGRAFVCAEAKPGRDVAVAEGAGTGLVAAVRALLDGGSDG